MVQSKKKETFAMSNLKHKQADQLKQIGEYLGQERQQQGVTLEEVALKTYIPLRLLQALETGQLERLPEPVFVQGFIRRYADTLGLDGLEVSKRFSVEPSPLVSPIRTSEPPATTDDPSAVASQQPPTVEPVQPVAPTPVKLDSTSRNSLLPWAIAGGTAVLLLGWAIASSLNRPTSPPASPPATTVPEPTAASPSASPAISPSPTEASPSSTIRPTSSPEASASPQPTVSPTTTTGGPVQVSLNLVGDAWVEIVADGKTEFSGMLRQGEQRNWSAEKSLVVFTGNAGGVEVSYNNGLAELMGKKGQLKELRFPPATNSTPVQPDSQ